MNDQLAPLLLGAFLGYALRWLTAPRLGPWRIVARVKCFDSADVAAATRSEKR